MSLTPHALLLFILAGLAGCDANSADADPNESPEPEAQSEPEANPEANPAEPEAPPTLQELPFEAFARAQLALSSCRPYDGFQDDLLARLHPPQNERNRYVDAVYACLADVTEGCDAVDACLQASRVELTADERAECESGCDGTIARHCSSNAAGARHWVTTRDCAAYGEVCAEGVCVEPTEVVGSCAAGEERYTCVGDWATECVDGERVRIFDCGTTFQRCVMHEDAIGPSCEGDGDACTFDDQPRTPYGLMGCDDGQVTQCGHRQQYQYECADLHPALSCQQAFGEPTCGLASACDDLPPRCDGDVLTACVAGQPMRIDCTELGLAGCLDCEADPFSSWCPARCAQDAEDLARGIDMGI